MKKYFLISFCLSAALLSGCGPTFPKEKLGEAVVDLCKNEYGLDVKAELNGGTIAAYLPIPDLLDEALSLPDESWKKINNVMFGISRISLSTDADIKFYVLISQDPAFPDIEVVIIRYIDDIKQYKFQQISITEFAHRTVRELKLTPQAQREKIITSLLGQMDAGDAEKILSTFIPKEVETIEDIGYWNEEFYIKDLTIEEFLAFQAEGRIRREFREDKELLEKFKVTNVKGKFTSYTGRRSFDFDFEIGMADPEKIYVSNHDTEIILGRMLDIAGVVLNGYKFRDYNELRFTDIINNDNFVVTKNELDRYRKNKIKTGDLIWKR